jgi:hypothetical protein
MATTKDALRKVRNKILTATDYLTTVTDINLTAKQKADALEYRQKLRDLTTDEYLNNLKFKVPEWLKINDSIKIYIKKNGIWTRVGKVITISKSSFTVRYDDDTTQIIKSNIYSRIV